MTNKTHLDDVTVEALQYLIQITIDSRNDLREGAARIKDIVLRAIVNTLAEQRNQQVSELRTLVSANFIEPECMGTESAVGYRAWSQIRTAIKGDALNDTLSELQAGEKRLLDAYEQILIDSRIGPVEDVLQRHYTEIRRAHGTLCSQ